MATNKQVVCDECGEVIVLAKAGENEAAAVVSAGGITAGANPSGKDLCSTHLAGDVEAQRALRAYIKAVEVYPNGIS